MARFVNLKTSTKLLVGFGGVLVLFAILLVMAFQAIKTIRQNDEIALTALAIENNLNEDRADILTMLGLHDAALRDRLITDLRSLSGEGDRLMARMRELAADNPSLLSGMDAYAEPRQDYVRLRDTQTVPLILKGQFDAARDAALGEQNDRYLAMRKTSRDIREEASRQAHEEARRAYIAFSAVGLVTLAAAILMVWLLNRLIARPLRSITRVAERIAVGDLPEDLRSESRDDEVGQLAQAFARMTHSLKMMATFAERIAAGDLQGQPELLSDKDVLGRAFETMTHNLRELTGELAEGINVLSASASQISTSTSQLAAGAMETATAITETTTTVEEVRQTAEVSNDKAHSVSASAQRAAEVSEAGRRSTLDTIEGMNRIQQQMDAIADSMMRLNEQSHAVGQIVATVEDLAGQSKLLAVNASIEAAKAGENGKGFAVVAQEVKSLADQSRQATTQVRTILEEIQKATGAAVLATEQGSHAVEAGSKQAQETGRSIQALADSIVEASEAAVQIAASSQQQLVGVDQVASAMESIKIAGEQNSESAKQLEGAAHSIKLLGEKLKRLADNYRI
jgi:methyl-accepting chemotaxis protein